MERKQICAFFEMQHMNPPRYSKLFSKKHEVVTSINLDLDQLLARSSLPGVTP